MICPCGKAVASYHVYRYTRKHNRREVLSTEHLCRDCARERYGLGKEPQIRVISDPLIDGIAATLHQRYPTHDVALIRNWVAKMPPRKLRVNYRSKLFQEYDKEVLDRWLSTQSPTSIRR